MKLSKLSASATTRDMIDSFRGYNHNLQINENEFYDMKNMCADNFPVLSTRKFRGDIFGDRFDGEIWGAVGYDNRIICVKDGNIYLNILDSTDGELFLGFTLEKLEGSNERQLVIMGAYLIIMPDKKYINLTDKEDFGDIEGRFEIVDKHPSLSFGWGTYTKFILCDSGGNIFNINHRGEKPSEEIIIYRARVENEVMSSSVKNITDKLSDLSLLANKPNDDMKESRDTFIKMLEEIKILFENQKYEDILNAYDIVQTQKNDLKTLLLQDAKDTEAITKTFDYISSEIEHICFLYDYVLNPKGFIEKEEDEIPDGTVWYNTEEKAVYKWNKTARMWSELITYVKIWHKGIGENFRKGDFVKISGIKDTYTLSRINGMHDLMLIMQNEASMGNVSGFLNPPETLTITDEGLSKLNAYTEIKQCDDDYIVVKGFVEYTRYLYLDPKFDAEKGCNIYASISRSMPETNFLFECGNRLWGCHYGTTEEGKFVNEIYSSKLGDFRNWSSYAGLSTDSYSASLGTEGKFTGGINYNGYPVFFKENCLHKVYGTYPALYQIATTKCDGVQSGSDKSLQIISGVLYYKSKRGVMAYDGSLPHSVSDVLGDDMYSDAVSLKHDKKYYISMTDMINGKNEMFVYNTELGLWHKEDPLKINFSAETTNGTYFSTTDFPTYFREISNENAVCDSEENFEWFIETGKLTMSYPDRKYCNRILIRAEFKPENGDIQTQTSVFIKYDEEEEWHKVQNVTLSKMNTTSFVIRPKRCDHMRLRICGNGKADIYSICKVIEHGSDISGRTV